MPNEKKKVRVTLDLTEDNFERLQSLEALVRAESKAAVIRNALQLYEYVAKRSAKGDRFQVVPSGEQQPETVVFLGLEP